MIKTAVTEDGYTYSFDVEDGRVYLSYQGSPWYKVLAIYPDRLDHCRATRHWDIAPDGRVAGYNEVGTRTALLIPDRVELGMIFWSAPIPGVSPEGARDGILTSPIVKLG